MAERKSSVALIVPSILSADFTCLGQQVAAVAAAGADRIQVDVMDGHFVPNISIGALGVEAARRSATLPIEAHLMITDPARYADDFLRAGADVVIAHCEVLDDPRPLLGYLRSKGARAGLAISPETPVERIIGVLDAADLILVMTVHPGFGGQEFIPEMLPKVRRVRELVTGLGLSCDIEVDGGIHPGTAAEVVAAGANVLVAGSSIFGDPEGPAAGMAHLRASIPA
jgi:ribulose-phosphate 3-epimerase